MSNCLSLSLLSQREWHQRQREWNEKRKKGKPVELHNDSNQGKQSSCWRECACFTADDESLFGGLRGQLEPHKECNYSTVSEVYHARLLHSRCETVQSENKWRSFRAGSVKAKKRDKEMIFSASDKHHPLHFLAILHYPQNLELFLRTGISHKPQSAGRRQINSQKCWLSASNLVRIVDYSGQETIHSDVKGLFDQHETTNQSSPDYTHVESDSSANVHGCRV